MAKKPNRKSAAKKSARSGARQAPRSSSPRRSRATTDRTPARTNSRPRRVGPAPPAAKAKVIPPPTVKPKERLALRSAVDAAPKPITEDLGAPQKPLTAAEIEELRLALLDKRAQIVGDVGTLQDEALRGSRREASGDLSSMPVHMADLGTDNYEMEFTLGLLEGGRALLHEIDEALERIRQGTYGICQATGRPIGKARLRAKPWAKFCYEYTLALERGQRHGL